MKRLWLIFGAALSAWAVSAAPVAVVYGNESLAVGERRFAQSLARHVERWYRESGVEVSLTDDADLKTALAGKTVAVLVYVSQPTAGQIGALSAFVSGGGKLIVCYSASAELASLMGVQPAGYQKGTTDGRWSLMRFVGPVPRGVPDAILQTSQNLYLVQPVAGRSQVMAWWCDRQGRQSAEPAWLSSSAGYWMTHVLLADGDAEGKGRLLLALAAARDDSLWQPAAARVLQRARGIGGANGVEGLAALAARVGEPARRARASAAALATQRKEREAEQLLAAGKGYEAWLAANELRERMYEVYGMVQSPRKGEIRAVWDHSGMGLYPGDWPRTCRLLKDAGFSDLYVKVAGPGFAHYASAVLPRSRVFEEQGDQLAACLAAAKPLGLRVHAWMFCFSTEGSTQDRIEVFRKRGWMLSGDGAAHAWLDPAAPEVRAYLVGAAKELATAYRVDGVHLDFVRYPDFNSSLGPGARARFEKATGRQAADWPEDVKSGALHEAFCRWRAEQVSDFVQSVQKTLKRDAPGKQLTAAVFGKYPSCLDAVGQDWESWINIGLVDYVVPMNYTEDMGKYGEWLGQQTRTRGQALKIVSGIGVTAAESRLDAVQVIDQIQAARRTGCAGFALFDLDTTLRQEILPVLRLGATAP